MASKRVMPVLLFDGRGLVKTIRFRNPRYVGDPINAIRIYNEKEVDELLVLDITATPNGRGPDFAKIGELTSECFMPMGYGGGITSVAQMEQILKLGVEKVCLNTAAISDPDLITAAAEAFGSQSVVVSIDVRRTLLGGYRTYTSGGRVATRWDPVSLAKRMESLGAGE